jgi:hypothetical protein
MKTRKRTSGSDSNSRLRNFQKRWHGVLSRWRTRWPARGGDVEVPRKFSSQNTPLWSHGVPPPSNLFCKICFIPSDLIELSIPWTWGAMSAIILSANRYWSTWIVPKMLPMQLCIHLPIMAVTIQKDDCNVFDVTWSSVFTLEFIHPKVCVVCLKFPICTQLFITSRKLYLDHCTVHLADPIVTIRLPGPAPNHCWYKTT